MQDTSGSLAGHVVVLTGAASGIGAAVAARLVAAGASVHALDIAPVHQHVAQALHCDLGDESSIDGAVTELPARVDMLMNCAGLPNGGRFSPVRVMAVNWFGLRHLSDRLLDRIPAGGSITHVASTAGRGWQANESALAELMHVPSFAAGLAWVGAHADVVGDGYSFSKQAVQYFTMWRALQIRHDRDVRMNSICPGVTNTQIAADFRRGVGDATIDRATEIAGRLAEPDEMAPAMLFLADQRSASYINGINLNVDRGTSAAHALGLW